MCENDGPSILQSSRRDVQSLKFLTNLRQQAVADKNESVMPRFHASSMPAHDR